VIKEPSIMRARNALRESRRRRRERADSEARVVLSLSLTHSVCWSWASAFCDAVNQYYGVHRGEWLCVCVRRTPWPRPHPCCQRPFPPSYKLSFNPWRKCTQASGHAGSRFFPFSLSRKPFPYFFAKKVSQTTNAGASPAFYFYCAPMS